MVDPIKLPIPTPPPNADAHARADTERNRRLFDWAEAVLKALGLDKTIAAARSIEELRRITLDVDSAEIALALRDALHPASGQRQEHFRGLKEGGLKLILKNRFADLKKAREATLRRGKPPDWTDELILDKDGKIVAESREFDLDPGEAPKWKGVLAYNEFRRASSSESAHPGEASRPTRLGLTTMIRWPGLVSDARASIRRPVTWGGRCRRRPDTIHSIQYAITSRRWPGTERRDWTRGRSIYFHAEDSPYIRAIGPRYLISSVARIYRPGCKVDHMLVLEGPQGKQKSEALRTLAVNDDWFTDRLSHVASKDATLDIAGVLIIEIAEMDALTPGDGVRDESVHHPPKRSISPALRQASDNPHAAERVRRHHQSARGGLSEGPDRSAAVLAGCLSRHDRPRRSGSGA